MVSRSFVITCLSLIALSIYLFVSAPPPLTEEKPSGTTIPIEQVFAIVEAENDVVRALWTQEIVGMGKKAGLQFDEDWREQGAEAGPLPALFLRETAKSLEKNPVQLSLFLGSDFPINDANQFKDLQMEKFRIIKQTRKSQFFFLQDTGLYAAMFADVAVVDTCIKCHNEHKQSPKTNWTLDEVMGATTWMYPSDRVTLDEMMKILGALRQGFREAYTAYLKKVETFSKPPVLGDKWPRDGYYLPSAEVFMTEAAKRASYETLAAIAAALEPSVKPYQVGIRVAPTKATEPGPDALQSLTQPSAISANPVKN